MLSLFDVHENKRESSTLEMRGIFLEKIKAEDRILFQVDVVDNPLTFRHQTRNPTPGENGLSLEIWNGSLSRFVERKTLPE